MRMTTQLIKNFSSPAFITANFKFITKLSRVIKIFPVFFFLLIGNTVKSQNTIGQTIKGVVKDADSKYPLTGITLKLSFIGVSTVSDKEGNFKFENVPVGVYTIEASGSEYESRLMPDIIVTSGKEVFITVSVMGRIKQLGNIIVTASKSEKPLNEFAVVSARTINLEMAKQYPANAFDPARLVQNFAGVSFADDKSNGIIIRGNSPKGLLWQLEGIEIPNPNHFGATGSGGGNISMLSSSTLDRSDFYTGAFPAEFGNAYSGVFDLKLRNGNKDKHEHSVMLGTLGLEVASEGPFKKGDNSSYLVNARYSTLALVKSFADIDGISPDYQDISFKLNFPTAKSGTFSAFGLGGINKSINEPETFTGFFNLPPPFTLIKNVEKNKVGNTGLSHQIFLNKKSFIKTVLVASSENYNQNTDTLDYANNYAAYPIGKTKFITNSIKASVLFNYKFNNSLTQQTGFITDVRNFNFQDRVYDIFTKTWNTFYKSTGNTVLYRAYTQWKWRAVEKITFIGGVHYTLLGLNNSKSLEPRLSVAYQISPQQNISLAGGIHSKTEHLSTYFFIPRNNPTLEGANKNLDLTKAAHFVLSYSLRLKNKGFIKIEPYFQKLYDVPVEKNTQSFFSMLNSLDIYDLYNIDSSLVNAGKGKNYGLDMTLEKSWGSGFNYMFSGSLFKSTYTTFAGKEFDTRFNRGYQVNNVLGKEWRVNKTGYRTLRVNIRSLLTGGLRESPIDYTQTNQQGKIIYEKDRYYKKQLPFYARVDFGIIYKVNRKHSTHSILFDIQNINNRKNIYRTEYDFRAKKTNNEEGLGLFPIINYRIEF